MQIRSSKRRAEFFLNESRDISTFIDFTVRKFARHNKIINKTRTTTNLENFGHCFGGMYVRNHLVKFLQDRKELERS